MKNKVDLAFTGMEDEIMKVIKSDPALAEQMRQILTTAKEMMLKDD